MESFPDNDDHQMDNYKKLLESIDYQSRVRLYMSKEAPLEMLNEHRVDDEPLNESFTRR